MSGDGSTSTSGPRLSNVLNGLSVAQTFGNSVFRGSFAPGALGLRVNAAFGSLSTPLSVAGAMTSNGAMDMVGAGAGIASGGIHFATLVAPRIGPILGFAARLTPGLGQLSTAVSLHQLAMNHPGYANGVARLAEVGQAGLQVAMSQEFQDRVRDNLADSSTRMADSIASGDLQM